MLELVLDAADALRPGAAEVAVVREHASEIRRIFLIQKKFQLLLAAVHVGRPQLAGQLGTLPVQLLFTPRLLRFEVAHARFGREPLRTDLVELLAGRLHAELGVAQLDGQLVPLLHVVVDRLADLVDPLVELAQLGLFLRRRLLGRGQDRPGQQDSPDSASTARTCPNRGTARGRRRVGRRRNRRGLGQKGRHGAVFGAVGEGAGSGKSAQV